MPPTNPIILVDANVWYSRTLRNWLGLLYTQGSQAPFRVRWTEDILAEVLYHLREEHPTWDGGRVTRIRDSIAGTFETGRVAEFRMDPNYAGVDERDRHVHSAAVACGAHVLLTFNIRDFPQTDLLDYEVLLPDEFLVLVNDAAPNLVDSVILEMCRYWLSRRMEVDLPGRLKAAGCPTFAEGVRAALHRLAPAISSLVVGQGRETSP